MTRPVSHDRQIKRLKARLTATVNHWQVTGTKYLNVQAELKSMTNDRDEWKRRFDALLALKTGDRP